MSFLQDLFGGADAAAQAQISGIQQGLGAATSNINQGTNALQTNYAAALAPYTQNYATAGQGTAALGNALGLGGPAGTQSALTQLQTTPGYQFTLGQGDNAINAASAANGTLNSGNQALALQQYGSGLAGQTYNNYVNQLQPYLGASNSAAGGIAGVNTGLGSSLNQNYNTLGNLNYGAQTSIGNANASADLANQGLGMSLFGGLGNLGVSAMGGTSGLGGGLGSLAGLGALFSDERLKEDIALVGELFDGTNVYRYKYIGDPTTRIGVLAQEVTETTPSAVHDVGGFLAVDYARATDAASELAKFLDAA